MSETQAAAPDVLHIRQIGARRHNLCAVLDGEATWPTNSTCLDCRRIYAGSGDSHDFPVEPSAVQS